MSPAFLVRPARWREDESAIARVRRSVFIAEQGVPEAMEWEDWDGECDWFVATGPGGEVVGIGRLTPAGRIGRMAVLPAWRRQGVGGALLALAIAAARRRGQATVALSAQIRAAPFYRRHGFAEVGPEYMEAGIPHQDMQLELGVSS